MKLAVKTKWNSPYKKQGDSYKTALPNVNSGCNCSGVYLIKSKRSKKVVYVGRSLSDLYKTIYRHFQTWNDRIPRVVYAKTGYSIRVIFTTKERAILLEKALIEKYNPRDNSEKYEVKPIEKAQAQKILNNAPYIAPYEEAPF